MPNLITQKFKINNAKDFVQNLTSANTSLYVFLSRPNPWYNDDSPPTPYETVSDVSTVWDEMVALKRINSTDVVNVVRRIDWTTDTVYTEYDNEDTELFTKDFYVLNSAKNVYKCIDNNGGNKSTTEPTGTSTSIFQTADGYRWKYLYSINSAQELKFLTGNWMPVAVNQTVADAAQDGAIDKIKIINGGVDYSAFTRVNITGDGSAANISAYTTLGVVFGFSFNNKGVKYRHATATLVDDQATGRNGNIRAIIGPFGGHGYDPIEELGSKYVMLTSRTEYNEGIGDFPGAFTYRQLGIVKNPVTTGNVLATVSTLNAMHKVVLSNVNGTFARNEFIQGLTSTANAYTVSSNVVSGNGYIKYIQSFNITSNFKPFTINETIIGKTSGATAVVSNLMYREVLQDTGDIIYLENRTPISRTSAQTDNLHLVIEF